MSKNVAVKRMAGSSPLVLSHHWPNEPPTHNAIQKAAIFPSRLWNSIPPSPLSLSLTMNQEPSQTATLRRRNSIAMSLVIPTKLSLHPSSILPPSHLNGTTLSPLDISLLSLKSSSSYTSLKDLLPSATVNSPTSSNSTTTSPYEISIRNRLVKHAAWAYLQPMSPSADSSGHFLRRVWLRFSTKNPITACFRFLSGHVIPSITSAFDRILHAIRVHVNKLQ